MSETTLFWSAIAVVGLAFAGFAWMFVSALKEGTDNYARTMGAETARQFFYSILTRVPSSTRSSSEAITECQ